MSKRRRIDLVAAAGAALILVTTVIYISPMHQQGDQDPVWVLVAFLGVALLCLVAGARAKQIR